MTRVATFTQSPDTLLPSEFNTIEDDYEKIFQHKRVFAMGYQSGVQIRGTSDWSIIGPRIAISDVDQFLPQMEIPLPYWNPLDWQARGSRGISMRLRAAVFSHGTTALGANITTALRQVTAFGGATTEITSYVQPAPAGLTLVQTAPPAGTITISSVTKNDAHLMPGGFYTISTKNSVTPNSGASVQLMVEVSFTMV